MRYRKREFGIVFNTMNSLDVVSKTLPSIIEEVSKSDALLIIHDTSNGEDRKIIHDEIEAMLDPGSSIYISSSNMPASVSRNMGLHILLDMANPEYICFLEDDHGFKSGFLEAAGRAIEMHHGKVMSNGLRAGLFSGCSKCNGGERVYVNEYRDFVRPGSEHVTLLGGVNACCRMAKTSHWLAAIKGFDIDEYYISEFQTSGVNYRNYNLGYCSLIFNNGDLMFDVYKVGRGTTSTGLRLWDNNYTASDSRSTFKGKEGGDDLQKQQDSERAKAFTGKIKGRVKHLVKKIVR